MASVCSYKASVAEWLVCETQFRGFFLVFLVALYRADFCRVLASVCEAKLRLCVSINVEIHLKYSFLIFFH